MGDLNAEPHDNHLKDFCDIYNLKTLIKVATCFKNPDRPTCIDVMLLILIEVFTTHVQLKRDYQIFVR